MVIKLMSLRGAAWGRSEGATWQSRSHCMYDLYSYEIASSFLLAMTYYNSLIGCEARLPKQSPALFCTI